MRADLKEVATAVAGAGTLALGATGPTVEALQRALRGVGAYTGKVTGTYDAATQAAVTRLQQGKQLPATGIVDAAELAALRGQQLFVKSGFQTAARIGQQGTDILSVERKLHQLGFDTGKADGVFDAKTLRALHQYRKADPDVADKGDAIGANVLKGLRGEVKDLELGLKLVGKKPGVINGTFDKMTERALKGFQKQHHLRATGVADRKTQRVLDQAAAKAGRFPQVKPGGFQKGYDVSHYQSQATFNDLIHRKGTRFMALKATEGTGYTDPTFKSRWSTLGKKLEPGKFDLRIAYHFLTPGNGRAQADHFLRTLGIHGKLKPGTRLALDWEAQALGSPATLKAAAARIHQVTGTWPLIYTSASRVAQAHQMAPHSPIWDAHWTPTSADYKFPFVQTGIKGHVDQDVFAGSELALRKWAGWF